MKTSRIKAQKGFTLIEVSLAIVIGVIILAGAITLYNQSKLSAGNSKAQEKSLALASLAEEMAANNNGQYPLVTQLNTAWLARRDDAGANPWGGALNAPLTPVYQYALPLAWGSNTGAGFTAPGTLANGGGLFSIAASAGAMLYDIGTGTQSIYDANALVPHAYANVMVGLANNNGVGFTFTNGGK